MLVMMVEEMCRDNRPAWRIYRLLSTVELN